MRICFSAAEQTRTSESRSSKHRGSKAYYCHLYIMVRMGLSLLALSVFVTAVQATSALYHLLDENDLIRIGTSNSCLEVESLHHETLGQVVKPTSKILVSQCCRNVILVS